MTVSSQSRLLLFGPENEQAEQLVSQLREQHEIIQPHNMTAALQALQTEEFSGLFLLGRPTLACSLTLEAGGILEQIPDGVLLVDSDLRILWANSRTNELTGRTESLVGWNFYETFGSPEILGPDFCPFSTALGTGESARSTIKVDEKKYFDVHAEPVQTADLEEEPDQPFLMVVIVRDISQEMLQKNKLKAIHQAGLELGDLSPQELAELSVPDRIELLKAKILHFTEDLLEFETVEIRLLDKRTRRLEPLMAYGMSPEASDRELLAEPQGNGVTGFVAATGKSYLCEETANDPLYLEGAPGARSSLTVPLVLHDEVLGTFNVESPLPGAFDENDLQFLELFSREVAVALNTLELMVAEKMTAASESTLKILNEVAGPVDDILQDAAWILERYIGHEPAVCERLQKILQQTRQIKQTIQRVGESVPEGLGQTPYPPRPQRPLLRGKRILVVDSDVNIRRAAHELLGRYGCEVETAHHGAEACLMARSFPYDAVIADIRLPDLNGYECYCKLKEINERLPVILMTEFGYDPTHSIVNARQKGLKSVLYKPFRLDQLLGELEKTVAPEDKPLEPPQ